MEQDFFTYLPPEITINILSRLPVRTAVSCKCVRKSWRSLIETPDFVQSYKSVPSLAVFEGKMSSIPYKVYEIEDELNLENSKNPCNVAFNFSLPQPKFIESSANGLLLLSDLDVNAYNLAICNPVTREYINLPLPFEPTCEWHFQKSTFGFGVSKTSGQYKIVRVFHEERRPQLENWEDALILIDNESHCQVYTLGTGLWRTIAPSIPLRFRSYSVEAFVNGNVHWLASDSKGSLWISRLDLETELFSTFSPPHLDASRDIVNAYRTLFAFRDCLGLCDNSRNQLVLWLMNTYGDEKSWTKQFVFTKPSLRCDFHDFMYVFKVFKDGVIMLKRYGCSGLLCYFNKTSTIPVTDLIVADGQVNNYLRTSAACYTPSFFRLKTFAMENVSSF